MKRLLVLLTCVGMLVSLAACASEPVNSNTNNSHNAMSGNSSGNQSKDKEKSCAHSWQEQTCVKPKTCILCGETSGTAAGHNYEDATCSEPKKCQICGETSGSALGHQYASGYCIRCNAKDPDYVEYGTVRGTVTYKYNDLIGNRGDAGAHVILFPMDKETKDFDNGRACLGIVGEYESGIMVTKCDGNGNYTFDNVPTGKYYVFIVSSKTTDGSAFDNYEARKDWIKGNFMQVLSEEDIDDLTKMVGYYKIYAENISVLADRTNTISKDFGVTYI